MKLTYCNFRFGMKYVDFFLRRRQHIFVISLATWLQIEIEPSINR